MKATVVFAVLALLFAAPSHGQDCLTQSSKLDSDVLDLDLLIDLYLRLKIEYNVNDRVGKTFHGVQSPNGTFFCATGTPSSSLSLGQIAGLPEGLSGQAQCALYCQTYNGCTSFNYFKQPLADGTQCQLFTAPMTACTVDPNCLHYEYDGQNTSCRSPAGFNYFPITKTYYRVVMQPMTWAEASDYCLSLNPFAHLAAFRTLQEWIELTSYLRTFRAADVWKCSTNASLASDWTGWWVAKRKMNDDAADLDKCKSAPMVQSLNTNRTRVLPEQDWESQMNLSGAPDCSQNYMKAFKFEMCMSIPVNHLYQLNDIMCDYKMCAVCQLDTL